MNDTTKIAIIGLLSVLLVGFGIWIAPSKIVVQEKVSKLGALASPEIQSPYVVFNGFWKDFVGRVTMTTGTTTPCVYVFDATSTLIAAHAQFTNASSTQALVATWGKNPKTTGTYATTTYLAQRRIAANEVATFSAFGAGTTTETNVDSPFLFGPGDKLILGLAGGQHPTPGLPVGTCSIEIDRY